MIGSGGKPCLGDGRMAIIYVARSANLSQWASDVGLSKFVFKVGVVADDATDLAAYLAAASWAGESDWTLVKCQDAGEVTEEVVLTRLAGREKQVDPAYYPRLKGLAGLFKITPVAVANHLIVARALAGEEDGKVVKPKVGDFATYLIAKALRA